MAAYNFPSSPTLGQRYPAVPQSGKTQYEWNGTAWDVVPPYVRTGNQAAYNNYTWPVNDGTTGTQLTTNGVGGLTWAPSAVTSFALVTVNEAFDGVRTSFTLTNPGTTTPFVPTPSSNIVIFLGGVPQIPNSSYTITGSTVTFTEAPLNGSTFYAISSRVV